MLKVERYDEAEGAKTAFLMCYAMFSIFFMVVMHFVILMKGWGLSIHSWSWMIFFWVACVIVTIIKDIAIKAINKASEY